MHRDNIQQSAPIPLWLAMDQTNILIAVGVTSFVALLFVVVFFFWRRQYGLRPDRTRRRTENTRVIVVRKSDIEADRRGND